MLFVDFEVYTNEILIGSKIDVTLISQEAIP